jgi:phage terminase large subunit-like protein
MRATGRPRHLKTPEDVQRAIAAEDEFINARLAELRQLKEEDPFYFYQPTDGTITPERGKFLGEFLRPGDIPTRLDSAVDVHACTANIIGVSGGNQSSKTVSTTIEDLIKACRIIPPSLKGIYPESKLATKKNNRIRVVCMDYTHGVLNHNLPALRYWVPKDYLIDRRWEKSWSAEKMTLTLVHPVEKQICATIELMTNEADVGTFQGPPLDRVRFDEEPREKIFDENLIRFATSEKLDIAFGMTPTNGLSWVYDRLWNKDVDETGQNSIRWFQLCSISNPKANLKSLREICANIKTYDELRMRLLGEWISLSGLVYGAYFKRRIHVIPPSALGLGDGEYLDCHCPGIRTDAYSNPADTYHDPMCPYLLYVAYLGLDPHEVKATAAVVVCVDRDERKYIDRCYLGDKNLREVRDDLHAMLRPYRYGFGKCDPHADSDRTAFDNINAWKILTHGDNPVPNLRKADSYKGSILAGVDIIRQMLKDETMFILDRPENQLLIQSMRTLQRDAWANEDTRGPRDAIMEGKHDHHAAMRYIFQSRLGWYPHEQGTKDEFAFADQEAVY